LESDVKHRWARPHEVGATHFRGYVEAAYEHIVAEFGDPVGGSADGKTQVEWRTVFEDGTVATIYDYKCDCDPRRHRLWHVGGEPDSAAVERVVAALGSRATVWTEDRPFV
jgi:hypothetical protein